jgi:hypothetical protein
VVGAATQCNATVSGAAGNISGEPILWGASGNVISGQGCTLFSQPAHNVHRQQARPGDHGAPYNGDASNGASMANAT